MVKLMSDARVYVPLDVLLDTRYATIRKVAGDVGEQIVSKWYHKRVVDKFGRSGTPLTDEAYNAAYTARDEDTLALSTMTFVPQYLVNLVSKYTANLGKPLMANMFDISINVWPYNLPEARVAELKQIIRTYTGDIANVDIVYIPDDKLTVEFISSQYDLCFMYDFNAWLMLHTEEFKQRTMPTVSFITPKLHLTTAMDGDIIKSTNDEATFESVSMILRGFLAVYFLDVRLFSRVTDTHPSFSD